MQETAAECRGENKNSRPHRRRRLVFIYKDIKKNLRFFFFKEKIHKFSVLLLLLLVFFYYYLS